MNPSRDKLLRELIEYLSPSNDVMERLSEFGWDCEKPLAILACQDVINILNRYVSGELTESQVTDWANLVECREDIAYPASDEELLANMVYCLANPDLGENITKPIAEAMLNELSKSKGR